MSHNPSIRKEEVLHPMSHHNGNVVAAHARESKLNKSILLTVIYAREQECAHIVKTIMLFSVDITQILSYKQSFFVIE